jgi:hypothetical protein
MDNTQPPLQKSRLGFHYYPDTIHFREHDISTWLPELQALAVSWLTIQAPLNRAIPESFIRKLVQHEIQPLLHFHYSPAQPPSLEDFSLLCRTYARWGVQYMVLFDRPNLQANWTAAAWAKSNLVERFLDVFQPLALVAIQTGLVPVFPPLEPGGDYWDTAFLRTAFDGLLRRNQTQLLDQMAISCYAWSNGHPLNWGSGGPEHWPASRPYDTPKGSEDQRGFRIFDWYLAYSEAVFGEQLPVFALAAGALPNEKVLDIPSAESPHTTQSLLISRLIMGDKVALDPLPSKLMACSFWLLTAANDHPDASASWYKPDGTTLPAVTALKQWAAAHKWSRTPIAQPISMINTQSPNKRPISHYLLLASSDLEMIDNQKDIFRSLVNKYHPTIGFSPSEAVHASRVTVFGNRANLPDAILDGLITAGCQVDDLRRDGTTIATKINST